MLAPPSDPDDEVSVASSLNSASSAALGISSSATPFASPADDDDRDSELEKILLAYIERNKPKNEEDLRKIARTLIKVTGEVMFSPLARRLHSPPPPRGDRGGKRRREEPAATS